MRLLHRIVKWALIATILWWGLVVGLSMMRWLP